MSCHYPHSLQPPSPNLPQHHPRLGDVVRRILLGRLVRELLIINVNHLGFIVDIWINNKWLSPDLIEHFPWNVNVMIPLDLVLCSIILYTISMYGLYILVVAVDAYTVTITKLSYISTHILQCLV